jgi:UDP-N-acetylmuramoyl-tripeptide--D-alanyl-D-alanine ligase
MALFTHVVHALFVLTLAYYVMSAMQWYNYRLERVVLHYHRYDWHLWYGGVPLLGFYLIPNPWNVGWYLFYGAALFFWARTLDKKLIFTPRVKRFFLFLILTLLFQTLLCTIIAPCEKNGVIIPLFIAHLFSLAYEKIAFEGFKKEARQKLLRLSHTKTIAITASYGKTSIKNFLTQILSTSYKIYATPRSVNTLGGIVKDINEALPLDVDFYIVEAGARQKGDIDEIARFVNPHICVIGCIGEQHIEYFKTLENIRNTKMELLHSAALERAFVHESACVKPYEHVSVFGSDIESIETTLHETAFTLRINGEKERFTCKLLGEFNAINLAACVHVALYLGMTLSAIKNAILNLKGVEHRLQKIEAGGKIIIDDSFNGNLEGMLSSYALVKTYKGRKVIITPGIIESTPEANTHLGEAIDAIFDVVILTGKTNIERLDSVIKRPQKFILSDKAHLQALLAEHTYKGDVILFSNDAPSFI